MKLKYLLLIILLRMKCSFEAADEENFTFYAKGASYNRKYNFYLIPFGGDIDLYCNGDNADRLTISLETDLESKVMQTERVNQTTIRLNIKNQEIFRSIYECVDNRVNINQSIEIYIIAGNATGISNFSCIYDDFCTLNCSWEIEEVFQNYNLSLFVMEDGERYLLCRRDAVMEPSKFYSWNIKRWLFEIYDLDINYNYDDDYSDIDRIETITRTFHTEACTLFGCVNQTFLSKSVFKLRPPDGLEVLNTSSHSAHLWWRSTRSLDSVDHDIECWLRTQAGNKPCAVNTSNIFEDQNFSSKTHLMLDLPCPDAYYDVRISIRPANGTKDRLWSDFATISFKTDKKTEKGLVNEMCEGNEKVAQDMKRYLRSKLSNVRNNVIEEISQIKNKLKMLKERAARIKQEI